ncbi:MAG: VWA domain-containing protein [Pyrinomonadaceae bacterium]|nr:VWA domain-containing protein [Pyrinomonadaceae bacterium]MBP6212065.1 VWA domain-containing protein [Pyrinomonadaceae bacterium]
MKLCFLTIFIMIAAASAAYPQSGRVVPGGNGRSNQRTPEPTSTPVVASVSEAADVVDDEDVIKVETQLVSMPVRVMDKKGRFAGGLVKENFRVFEDGVEQQISLFSNENEPFTVALVLDMSYSTTFKIAEIQSAAIAFIAQLRPQDKVMVISFDQEVHMLCEATGDRNAIYQAIKRTRISTGTSLYEAVDLTINDRMRRVKGRKAIILFTDGVDTTSRRAHDLDNLNDAMELDSLIYTIRYDTFADVQQMKGGSTSGRRTQPSDPFPSADNDPMSTTMPTSTIVRPGEQGTTAAEYQRAEQYLDQLALRTGGRLYQAKTLGNLADAYSKIASELREFYSIGYYPSTERVAGKRSNVKVKVDHAGLVVRAREGYMTRRKKK